MSVNLLSVHRFCRDNLYSFHFDANWFQIQDLLTRKPLYKGFSKDGLHPIHGLSLPSLEFRVSSFFSRCNSTSSSPASARVSYAAHLSPTQQKASQTHLWHMLLGHPQCRVLSHVLNTNFNGSSFPAFNSFCKHCVMGKMTQLPFSNSTSCTTSSINGHRYYVIFVDDFTRFTWFFPLKHKSQVLSSFQHFKHTMENLLKTSIKILRTNCGGEYTNNEFRNFCSNSGVLHQFTCSHTSQQNGVFE